MQRLRLPSGIRLKINLGILTILLLSSLMIAGFTSQIVSQALFREYRNRGLALALNLADRSEDPLLALDYLRMKTVIEQVAASAEDISYAFIQDHDGQVLSHTFSGGFPVQLGPVNAVPGGQRFQIRLISTGSEEIYDFATPVMAGTFRVGTVRLGLLRAKISATVTELFWSIIAVTILAVVTADIVGFTLSRNLTGRIQALRDVSEALVRGDLGVRAVPAVATRPPPGSPAALTARSPGRAGPWAAASRAVWGDEIDQLARTFDAMTQALRGTIESLASSKEVLQRSEARYRRIFEDSMDMIFIADRDGRLVDVNPAGRTLLAFADRNALSGGVGLGEVIKDPAEAAALLAEVRSQGYVKDRECTLMSHTGGELEVLLSITARKDEMGEIVEFEGIVKDITRRKLMRRQLLQADKLASLGQLSAGVAHEINNPLAIINEKAGLIQDLFLIKRAYTQDPKLLSLLEAILASVKRAGGITKRLLAFARNLDAQVESIDLADLIQEVLGFLGKEAQHRGIAIRVEAPADTPRVEVERGKLQQIFLNIINNAMAAVADGGHLDIHVRPEGPERVAVDFIDDGCGIPRDDLSRIFEPFFSTKAHRGGTGLGLSITYNLTQEIGGRLAVESALGQGTRFTVSLPLKQPPRGTNNHACTAGG